MPALVTMRSVPLFWLLICAGLMEALLLILHWLGDLRYRAPETIGLMLLTSLLYLVSCHLILGGRRKENLNGFSQLTLLVIGVSILFRITVWPLAPALSDDVYRYRWEGQVQAAGGNPYQARPNDPEWAGLRDEAFPRVVGKDFKAGYGPFVMLLERWTFQAVSAFTANPEQQAFWFKTPAAVFDIAVLLALWALLAAHGLPAERVLIYGWSPLAVMEFWGTGHNDTVAITFILLALLAAKRERWTWAFAALTMAACSKLWPLALFPIFVGARGWRPVRWHQWWVAIPITGLLVLPFWSNIEENARFMTGFIGGWRNNDSLFGLLLWLFGDPSGAKRAAMVIVALTVILVTLRRLPLERACLVAIAVMLLVSANCHPWYLSWFLPLLAFAPVFGLLLWTALMPIAYQVLIDWVASGEWRGSTPWRWLIYVPVFAALAAGGIRRLRRQRLNPAQRG